MLRVCIVYWASFLVSFGTLLHFGTFDIWYTGRSTTRVGTQVVFWYIRIVIGHFRYVGTVSTFGTPAAFGTSQSER